MIVCPACDLEAADEFAFRPKCAVRPSAPASAAEERKTVTTLFRDLVAFADMSEFDTVEADALPKGGTR